MKKTFFIRKVMLIAMVAILASCNGDDHPSSVPNTTSLYLRFIDANGENVLDGDIQNLFTEDFAAECSKGNAFVDYVTRNITSSMSSDKVLVLIWGEDLDSKVEDFVYTLKISSHQLFHDAETHTINIYVTKKDRQNMKVTKVEMDGSEVTFDDDPWDWGYEWMSNIHLAIDVHVK